jgi:hypothetical protein
MRLEVIATPDVDSPARLGERFTPRDGAPLRIGPSREARLRLPGEAGDVEVHLTDGALSVRVPAETPRRSSSATTPRASLSGVLLARGEVRPLQLGDTLYVHPGLALTVRAAPMVTAREPGLEERLRAGADDVTWAVYADFLEERGDALAGWLRSGPTATEDERRRQLGALAESVRCGALDVRFDARGLLEAAQLSRTAVLEAPRLPWHLTQLGALPVARFLSELRVALFTGPAPSGAAADAVAARVLEQVLAADFAPGLRRLGLGFVTEPREWPRTADAFERLCARAPHLERALGQLIRRVRRARLQLVAHPPAIVPVSDEVALHPGRSDVGAAPSCLVRLAGDAPGVACSLHRTIDGQWVAWDVRTDPFSRNEDARTLRVNGVARHHALLAPGDLLEPTPGLVFRFLLD